MTFLTCFAVGCVSLLLPGALLAIFFFRLRKESKTLKDQCLSPNLVYRKLHEPHARKTQTAEGFRPFVSGIFERMGFGKTADQDLMIAAVVTAAWSIAFVLCWRQYCGSANYSTLWPGLHVILWTVVPPVFFFYQWKSIYLCIFTGDEYKRFKMGQDLATKVWAAIALVLGAIYKFGP